jgi:protein-disulfide isomerase
VFDQLLDKYSGEVKIVFKHFPRADQGLSRNAASAALAAHRQNRFWEFHVRLVENLGKIDDAKIHDIAKELNLDSEKFKSDLQDPDIQDLIDRDVQDGRLAKITGVPTIFVNGRHMSKESLKGFEEMIEAELHKDGRFNCKGEVQKSDPAKGD